MSIKIAFGTDGWRGIIASDFIFANVRLVTRAVADYIIERGMEAQGVVIGYDNRFMSDRFAEEAAEELLKKGIKVFTTCSATPTPVTAYAIKVHQAAGAVMITASHNPPEYNGFKFIPDYAGPALPHITKEIEANINKQQMHHSQGLAKKIEGRYGNLVERDHYPDCCIREDIQPIEKYLVRMGELVDLEAIGRAGLKVVVDPMYGAGIGYLDGILQRAGAQVETLHNYRDPLFGGGMPEPTGASLTELRQRVLDSGADLGLALDGDADRFGIIDRDGSYITPNQFLPMLYYHMMEVKGLRGSAARTVATTHLMDVIAHHYGQEVVETAVGFKYIGQCLNEKNALMGGEESGGVSIRGHIPEKDGILAGLLAAELVAIHGKSLQELMAEVCQRFGTFYSSRLDLRTTPEDKERILAELPHFQPETVAGVAVTGRVTLDGLKLLLADGSWALIRPSGTEPLFRVYGEAANVEQVEAIQQEIKEALKL